MFLHKKTGIKFALKLLFRMIPHSFESEFRLTVFLKTHSYVAFDLFSVGSYCRLKYIIFGTIYAQKLLRKLNSFIFLNEFRRSTHES